MYDPVDETAIVPAVPATMAYPVGTEIVAPAPNNPAPPAFIYSAATGPGIIDAAVPAVVPTIALYAVVA